MAYSPIKVLPEPVGAQTTTDLPAARAAIADCWKSSSLKGKMVLRSKEVGLRDSFTSSLRGEIFLIAAILAGFFYSSRKKQTSRN